MILAFTSFWGFCKNAVSHCYQTDSLLALPQTYSGSACLKYVIYTLHRLLSFEMRDACTFSSSSSSPYLLLLEHEHNPAEGEREGERERKKRIERRRWRWRKKERRVEWRGREGKGSGGGEEPPLAQLWSCDVWYHIYHILFALQDITHLAS